MNDGHGSIRGLQPGHMLGEIQHEAESWEYTDCPVCGGRMRKASEMCAECWNKERAGRWAEDNWPAILERHHRFEAALEAGWQLRYLWFLARIGKIPTWAQIVARAPDVVIKRWWKMTREV